MVPGHGLGRPILINVEMMKVGGAEESRSRFGRRGSRNGLGKRKGILEVRLE